MLKRDKNEKKILDVDASMQGTLTFKDPVNLRINGDFEGKLDTKGILTISANAFVRADINGDEIVISGKVTKVSEIGAFIDLGSNLEGLIHILKSERPLTQKLFCYFVHN